MFSKCLKNPHDRYALDVVVPDTRDQLFAVVGRVQLGTAEDRVFAAHELLMQIGIGIGGTVGGNQEFRAVMPSHTARSRCAFPRLYK